MRKRSNLKNRVAFTLMELLLVMSILVIMGGMVTYAFVNIGQNATMDLAGQQIKMLEDACMSYKIQHLKFPNTLQDLRVAPSGMTDRQWRGPFISEDIPLDPWGQEYQYSRDERQNIVIIRSGGPDGQIGGVDDIPDPQAG